MQLKWATCLLLIMSAPRLFAQTPITPTYVPLAEAWPVIHAHSSSLPGSLSREATQDATAWAAYLAARDREVRSRLESGDLDTLANLLLFGTSYTDQPVITPALLREITSGPSRPETRDPENPAAGATPDAAPWNIYRTRLRDLTLGLRAPGNNERLIYMRKLLEKKGFGFGDGAHLDEVQKFLATNLVRMLRDDRSFAAALKEAQAADSDSHFNRRSRVFETRGISLDTSLFPNLAVEEALRQLKREGLLPTGSVTRVAVVGPGLDVMNKDAGFDFYPEQTIQPFALMDSLLRLGLAKPAQLSMTTLDISGNVNSHIAMARQKVSSGRAYVLQLPLAAEVAWRPEALAYWNHFGDQIGKPVPPISPLTRSREIKVRAVQVASPHVLRVKPVDLNIVLQRLTLPEDRRFDLIIGTNIFVYYGEFEQELAELNIARMLKTNGILLTNDALPTGEGSALEQVNFSTTIYSDRSADGDRIVWMRKRSRR